MPKPGTGKPRKKQKKTDSDEDFQPERRFPTTATTNENASFLDQHADWIIDMMGKRTRKTGPEYIAKMLCRNNGLREGAIHGKQISNWYGYRVRTGKIPRSKRKSVSAKNKNMPAANSDCMSH
jgi:hypothetical protein